MGGCVEDARHRSRLDHPPGIHHRELIAHLGDDAEIVGDEDQRETVRLLQVAQHFQVLRLDRQVEAGGRLVGNQEARLAGNPDGADDALAHAARHLVRVLLEARFRRRDAHRPEQFARPVPGGRPALALMHPDRLGHLVADREQRVQRHHRVLQDHRDPLAADMLHLIFGFLHEILALEQHPAADDARGRRQDAHDGEGERAFPGAAFPDNAQGLPGIEAQRHLVDSADDPRALRRDVVRRKVVELEQRRSGRSRGHQSCRSCGSNLTLNQSPNRFADSTISTMQPPGNTVSHQ